MLSQGALAVGTQVCVGRWVRGYWQRGYVYQGGQLSHGAGRAVSLGCSDSGTQVRCPVSGHALGNRMLEAVSRF